MSIFVVNKILAVRADATAALLREIMPLSNQLASVDLGSNSFRLHIVRVEDQQIYPLDTIKDSVRLAAGLLPDGTLDEESKARAMRSFAGFAERLRGMPAEAVRVVATNTLRIAKDADIFLQEAQACLGFPIEIIAGSEEARLIYIGAAHGLPPSSEKRLVVDVGGGSTEFIIGQDYEPQMLESLQMGCVSYTKRFFANGEISKHHFKQAELVAGITLEPIAACYGRTVWQQAIGTSGTARSICEVLIANGWAKESITREGLARLRQHAVQVGSIEKLQLPGLRADRQPVLAGGLAIMQAVFDSLGIDEMRITHGALRDGVLYDLLGRHFHNDRRTLTVEQFQRRYQVDVAQAERVSHLALKLFRQLSASFSLSKVEQENAEQQLIWAAKLHEIGLSIAHSGYHKHGAYIVLNADMPGFGKPEQSLLSALILAHRGGLEKARPYFKLALHWLQAFALRLAIMCLRSRSVAVEPPIRINYQADGFHLTISAHWLAQHPLTQRALLDESDRWQATSRPLFIHES